MTPPRKIRVGPHLYTVVRDKETARHAEAFGLTDVRRMQVLIDPDQSTGALRDTLLHECLHAVFNVTGLGQEWGSEKDEAIVTRVTPALLALLRDNPQAVAFWMENE